MRTSDIALIILAVITLALLAITRPDVLVIVMVTIPSLVVLLYGLVLVDSITTRSLFFKGVGHNRMVTTANMGGELMKFFARVRGRNYNPKTGTSTEGQQGSFYVGSPMKLIFDHFADFWGVYYKGINTRLFKPSWCTTYEVPYTEVRRTQTTNQEVAGIGFDIDTTIVYEIIDLSLYFALGEGQDPFPIAVDDYHSEMRVFAVKRGILPDGDKPEDLDFKKFFDVATEITKDEDFKKGPMRALEEGLARFGMRLANISITQIEPSSKEDRELIASKARAKIRKAVTLIDADAEAEKRRIEGKGEADAIKEIGAAHAEAEDLLRVSDHRRLSIAIERTGVTALGGSGLIVDSRGRRDEQQDQRAQRARRPQRNEGETQNPRT